MFGVSFMATQALAQGSSHGGAADRRGCQLLVRRRLAPLDKTASGVQFLNGALFFSSLRRGLEDAVVSALQTEL
ncbi:MAG: hypothetical protein ACXVID_06520, partial [Thermoanaerobaculia bacterium]